MYSIIIAVILVGCNGISNYRNAVKSTNPYVIPDKEVVSIDINQLENIYSRDSVLLSKLHYQIRSRNIESIVILCKNKTHAIDRIMEEFNIYIYTYC